MDAVVVTLGFKRMIDYVELVVDAKVNRDCSAERRPLLRDAVSAGETWVGREQPC